GGLTSAAGVASFTFHRGWRGQLNGWRIRLMRRFPWRLRYTRLPKRLRKQEQPGSGTLSAEVASADRFVLPNRNYILFRSNIGVFADQRWFESAPWLNDFERGPDAQTPSLLWSADREWVVATEIDFDSTIVAGSRELIDALLAHPA